MVIKECKTNTLGTNKNIIFHLNEKNLKKYGFKLSEGLKFTDSKIPEHWHYHKYIADDITFNIDYYLKPYKGAQLEILTIDEDFGQPYDYQAILSRNPQHKFANNVFNEVEKEMKKLQEAEILSGHVYGEYI